MNVGYPTTPPMYTSNYHNAPVSPYATYQQPVLQAPAQPATGPFYTPFALHGGYFHPGEQYSPPVPGGEGPMGPVGGGAYNAYHAEAEASYRRKDRAYARRMPHGSLYADDGYGFDDPGRTWDRDWDGSLDIRPKPNARSLIEGTKKIRSIE